MSDRPYRDKSNYELARSFDANRRNLSVLKEIDHELRLRRSKKYRILREQVSEQIASLMLSEPPQATDSEVKAHRKEAPAVVGNIPGMRMSQLMKLWNNAVRLSTKHKDAQTVIKAIEKEWRRRGANPPRPDEYFEWPSTEADRGDGRLTSDGWVSEGVLSYMGYRVGNTNGLPTNVRHRILELVFEGELPPVFAPDYMKDWAMPRTAGRLKKMAETLAAFSRNGKRKRRSRMAAAVKNWEDDLRFLYLNFYVDRFHFSWPTTDL